MALYVVSEEIKSIAKRLQAKLPHNVGNLNLDRIVFLKELESLSKTKLAVTKKIDSALKTVYSQHDYIIIFFQKRWENLNVAQQNILVLHELMHCEPDGEKIRTHDVQEFFELAVAFGVNWSDNPDVKDPLSSEFNEVLQPKPALEPDKYAKIMEEDHAIISNLSSQYNEESDDVE